MNCLAVDDQPLALDLIEDFVSKVPFLNFIGRCTSAIEAAQKIKDQKVDLIFLDINMPLMTGLEFLKSLENKPMVIFTTAYPEYALEGFDLKAIDYLVKPIRFERFMAAINHAYELFKLKESRDQKLSITQDYIMIKVEYSTVKVNFDDILFIKGIKDYVQIHTQSKRYLTQSTMKNIQSKLPENLFMRVHKSYIIALSKIEKIERFRIKIKDTLVPVGESFKHDFLKVIKDLSL